MMQEETGIEMLVEQAKEGNQQALESVIRHIQNRVYDLALHMLQVPADAEDATQEILLKVVTHLSTFRQESAFTTWVYRIATNYLLTTRKRRVELQNMTLQQVGEQLDYSLAIGASEIPQGYDERLLIEEVRASCTLGMLVCLDRTHRIAFILGEIFEVSSEEGAYIMETTPINFRKRLSRARSQMRAFLQHKCGIANPNNPCRCSKHVGNKILFGFLDPNNLQYATVAQAHAVEEATRQYEQELCELDETAWLFRTNPPPVAPEVIVKSIKSLLQSGRLSIFSSSMEEK